jgi:molybdopterin molybdotransferase
MISFEEAYNRVLSIPSNPQTERILFTDSLNRILAEDVFSDVAMPAFDKSAVDGFACKKEDVQLFAELAILETIQAGQVPTKVTVPGFCTKIMTGAPIPQACTCVVMVENTETVSNRVRILKVDTKVNICFKAEDVTEGQKVLARNCVIKPQHIAVFAAVGYTDVLVYKKLKVGIISTGDELVEPHEIPPASKIRNSNSYQLLAQVNACGADAKYYGIAKDTKEDTYEKVTKALAENDIILLTGGVSMGEFDFVAEVLTQVGIKLLFDSIAVTPGKPTTFGTIGNKSCFGLPGNPVSSFVIFDILVKPFLYKQMGYDYHAPEISLTMDFSFSRKKTARRLYIPVIIEKGKVNDVEYHGSGHILALSFADAFIVIPVGKESIQKGEVVEVRML